MTTTTNMKNILKKAGAGLAALLFLLSVSPGLGAEDKLLEKMNELLGTLQANGEYILGAYTSDADGDGRIIVETPDGKKVFDEGGELLESTERNGNKTVYQNGMPVRVLSPSGSVVSETDIHAPNKDGSKWLECRDRMGNLERRRMNGQGEMVERVDHQGVSYANEALTDGQGKTIGVVETNQQTGDKTTRFFDPRTKDVVGQINPDGDFIQIRYIKDDKGHKRHSFELNTRTGQVTQKTFDDMGRETMVISPNGEQKTIEYETDDTGRVIATTETLRNSDAKNMSRQVRKELDQANRVTLEKDSLGRTVRYQYVLTADQKTAKIIEDETLINESGKTLQYHRVREMGADGRVKTLTEGLHRTDYAYTVGEGGGVVRVKETKNIARTGKKLYDMVTDKTPQGLPKRSEKWEAFGPAGKRHSITAYVLDEAKGRITDTVTINDLGEVTKTRMDKEGLPVSSETTLVHGPGLKRHSVTKIQTDALSKLTVATDTVNDLGERSRIEMDEYGLPVRSETWGVSGPKKKRHAVTQIQTNPETTQTARTVSVNDLGDVTVTVMDENGLPVSSDTQETHGPTGGRHKMSTIDSDPVTGLTRSMVTTDDLRETTTIMDENGMAVSTENKENYGPRLKRHSTSVLTNDNDTGVATSSVTTNKLGDKTITTMDRDGFAVASETWNALGARLRRHFTATITINEDTGLTSETTTTNDLGDVTLTRMDENGLPVFSDSRNTLGALLKRHSITAIATSPETGLPESTQTTDDLGDRTVTRMDKNGLPAFSETWSVLGPTLKRHSQNRITTNSDTGMTAATSSINDLGDRVESKMDGDGLPVSSEGWVTLGPLKKRHSLTAIKTNPLTGMTEATDATDDLNDRTLTIMDRDGLATRSESWNSLGPLLKRHSKNRIHTNRNTGLPLMTENTNDLGDVSITCMNAEGMAAASATRNVLGARKKRNSMTEITCSPETGITRFTSSVNELGERTMESKDENGFAVFGVTRGVLGPRLKRDSWRKIRTNPETGMPEYTSSTDAMGNFSETWMDEDGLAVTGRSRDVLGATAGRNKNTVMKNRPTTGMVMLTASYDALHDGPTTTFMDEDGLAYYSHSLARYGATAGAEKKTEMNTDKDTGITRATSTYDGLHQGPVISYMDENGLAVLSIGTDLLGATAGRKKTTQMENDQDTGITRATFTEDALHVGPVETRMDENGLGYYSRSVDRYGTSNGREKISWLTTRTDIGTLACSEVYDKLHDGPMVTRMNEHGLAYSSTGKDRYGAENGRVKETKIHTRPDLGTTEQTETVDGIHDGPVLTWMDENGFAFRSQSRDLRGPRLGRAKTTFMHTRSDIGTTEMTESSDGLHVGKVVTWMDVDGLAYRSVGEDRYGPEAGRKKVTEIATRKDIGTSQSTSTSDGLHEGPVLTQMDENGLPVSSQGLDRFGPTEGRKKTTQMQVDQKTGITRGSTILDGLHDGPTVNEMNEDGLVVRCTAVSKYGPRGARLQKTVMTPDTETGLTKVSESQTLAGEGGIVVSTTRTENDPILGVPRTSISESLFGAWKEKSTVFTTDPFSGLTLRSKVKDDGGYTVNQHGEFGIEKSMRYNNLGAIREVTTTNTLNKATGMPTGSVATDRKGKTTSVFNQDGEMTVSTRTNTGAHYIPVETTRVQTMNRYTGSPLASVSTDAHGTTEKTFDMDGFLERTIRMDQWGDRSITTYTNDKQTGLPLHSLSRGDSGLTETWYEKNGLACNSIFRATYGLNTISENYYDRELDMLSSKSVDERGNVSVSVFNDAGEVAQTFSKNGVTYMDLYNNRAARSSGPGGETTYSYSGRWLDSTVNKNTKGETSTSYFDHRPNGAARSVTTKDGTTNYQNTYNSRGFVTYRTESKGEDKGFSRFNDYGDQQYTEWTGKIKAGKPDQYGNQFLGGTWKSETTYNNNSRGDVLSWTTKSSWTGKQKYAEIGHYEFICDMGYDSKNACKGGHEEYKVDQPAHTKTVGKSDPPKTQTPESSPESDQWVLSHLSGTLANHIHSVGQPSKAMSDFETDATRPGYHSDYQKAVLTSLAAQGYAEELKKSFKPVVGRIQAMLREFAKTGNLMALYYISTYAGLDGDTFRSQFIASANKVQYLQQTVDTVYYHFSGEHLASGQFNVSHVSQALNLVNRPTSLQALQDWLEFMATPEEQMAVSQALQEKNQASAANSAELKAKQEKLGELLRGIALRTMGLSLSPSVLQLWIEKTVTSLADAQDIAQRLSNNYRISTASNPAATAVVLMAAVAAQGTVVIDENKITGQMSSATNASELEAVTNLALKKNTEEKGPEAAEANEVKAASTTSTFGKIAGTYSLSLKDQMAEAAKSKTQSGNRTETVLLDGSKMVFVTTGKEQVEAIAFNANGKKQGEAEYEGGWLTGVSMTEGSKITLTYDYKEDSSLKSVDVRTVKGEEEKVSKFDANGKLLSSMVRDGERMKVEEKQKTEETDALEDVLEDADQRHKDAQIGSDRKINDHQFQQQ